MSSGLPRWITSSYNFKACSHKAWVTYNEFSTAVYCSLLLWGENNEEWKLHSKDKYVK